MILSNKKHILFVTGTRADFGKIKSLISAVEGSEDFHYTIFITGMHTLEKYGNTFLDVQSCFKHTFVYLNQSSSPSMERILADTIHGLSKYLTENKYDMIVVHGDRVETLASAIVGSFKNILVTHIEGGEVSGTIDEIIRHSTSKLSHFHLVANTGAKNRLIQMGEQENSIKVIGSPDIDIMLSDKLPSIEEVKRHYEIPFSEYAVSTFHPVTTEVEKIKEHCDELMLAMEESNKNYVIIYPNNDMGAEKIFQVYENFNSNPRFKFYPSIRFEYFLTLLKNSKFIIGNSSAGIREAPVYGISTINIGTRQNRRYCSGTIANVSPEKKEILEAIASVNKREKVKDQFDYNFGAGKSASEFLKFISDEKIWKMDIQKSFVDIELNRAYKEASVEHPPLS